MRLQTKLILSFSVVTLITLAVAGIGYWQAQRLAAALYEVGAVRLPSIRGLDMINEGLTAIRAAERTLLAADLGAAERADLLEQERLAWRRVDAGWQLYEPLPQTAEEAAQWRAFVPAWQAWSARHRAVMELVRAHHERGDPALLARAREQSLVAEPLAHAAARLLAEITTINDEVAARAKAHSVASQQDMVTVKRLMLATAALGVACAIALGILLGRRISRPVEQMAEGFAAVARGDLSVHIPARSRDEIGEAARAMNSMVESLRNARATIQVISDNLPDCMIYQLVLEPDGRRRFTYVSAGVERLHGVTAEAVVRDPTQLFDRVVPEDRPALEAATRASQAALSVFHLMVRMRGPDGEVRWRQLHSQPHRLPDGGIRWDGIELDVTDRHQAEQALQESQARFRVLVSSSIVGMMMFAADGKKLEVNAALSRILGYSREELLKLKFVEEATHPDDREAARDSVAQLLAGAINSYDHEKRYRRKDGTFVWVHLHVSTLHDSQGRQQYFVAQFLDINARKLAEQSLRATAGQLKLALQASRLGVWQRDLASGAGQWDARMFEIFGLPATAAAPSRAELLELVRPEDRALFQAASGGISSGIGYDLPIRIRRPDGAARHISTQAIVQHDEAGRPVASIGVVADLTELVQATEESGRLREKLRQSQKMETLGTLAAGIAHDFNNLLTGINGFVELGVSTLPPGHEAVSMLRQAHHGATSARDLVRRILDFSRRAPDSERTVISLATFVRNAAPLITAGLPGQVSLSIATDDDAPAVRADPGQLQQVLMNLCVNGAHAIGDRSGTITIGLQSRAVAPGENGTPGPVPPGLYACLSVADTGGGMSAEVCARIFEPFFTTKKAGEGTGLGLAVVQDIVTEHDGFIRVDSTPGRGTTFEILLPACDAPVARSQIRPAVPAARGRGERILVVDDEPAITALTLRALALAGYQPEAFNSAPEAWARFTAAPGRFDLLLTDHQMPEITGLELAGRARRAATALPVVIMTARTHDLDPATLREIGGVAVLAKPFAIEELLAQVAAALTARPGTTPGVRRRSGLP